MTSKQNALYAERKHIKKQLKEVETVKKNVDRIFGNEEVREQKSSAI